MRKPMKTYSSVLAAALAVLSSTVPLIVAQSSYEPYRFSTLSPGLGVGHADGTGELARFNWPANVAVDNAGNVYVADTFNNSIRKVTPTGAVTTLAGCTTC